ncbi:hypothetical protein FIBSPDRAFT_876771, partial [Athelia psychrophila]
RGKMKKRTSSSTCINLSTLSNAVTLERCHAASPPVLEEPLELWNGHHVVQRELNLGHICSGMVTNERHQPRSTPAMTFDAGPRSFVVETWL